VAANDAQQNEQQAPSDPRSLPPVAVGNERARFVGTTPDGNWILETPAKGQVIVPPPPDEAPRKTAHKKVRRALPVDDAAGPTAPVDPPANEPIYEAPVVDPRGD
jgi:hypothetical protein